MILDATYEPFCQNPALKAKTKAVYEAYRIPEAQAVQNILTRFEHELDFTPINTLATSLITSVRSERLKALSIENFLQTHKLSSQEGLAMMCLAEALLRIPDARTKTKFIRDKVASGNWESEENHPLSMRLANLGLQASSKILNAGLDNSIFSSFTGLLRRFGTPAIRSLMVQAVKIMGQQFVMAEGIERALKETEKSENKPYLFTFDMLGEAAKTAEDAQHYFKLYNIALDAISEYTLKKQTNLNKPSLSIKLSALHPRFEFAQQARVREELIPQLLKLLMKAAKHNIEVTIDAEESERLTLTLEIFETLFTHEELINYYGLGIAVQAYQKRAPYVVDWLIALARTHQKRLNIRLVKGAYWDSEIKRTQVNGYGDYAVFTQKAHTDACYLLCAEKMLMAEDEVFPQFATHNAHTLAAIYTLAKSLNVREFEFQRLHGMGESLYENFFKLSENHRIPCRVYAPVGVYRDLLPYLVRRLLENGANTSFVNHIYDTSKPIESLTLNPIEECRKTNGAHHPQVPPPGYLFAPDRLNSPGIDVSDLPVLKALQTSIDSLPREDRPTPRQTDNVLDSIIKRAHSFQDKWAQTPVTVRAQSLERLGKLMTDNFAKLLQLLVTEGKKTIPDAISEIREAIDFCHYYGHEAVKLMQEGHPLPGPTGEVNKLYYFPRGTFLCISPWNFPLAIFIGEVTAALVTGNTVIAKPSSATVEIAAFAVELAYKAGIPTDALILANCSGEQLSQFVVPDPRISGVVFTGSTETAKNINRILAERPGPIVPFIAETGGINAMVVDSSALPEQVVSDVITSAFQSAGQRCSALRILCLQQDVAEDIIQMLVGAVKELKIGDPSLLSTDIGPVISHEAKNNLRNYLEELRQSSRAECLHVSNLLPDTEHAAFVSPQIWQVPSIQSISRETFGPILHVVTYRSSRFDRILDDINSLGYGLTFGIHSRLESTIQHAFSRIKAGNIYVNRSMIGAVVGVQPFGGEGLSGTGFKAGGPNYLLRFLTERTYTHDTTAAGGNASLMALV